MPFPELSHVVTTRSGEFAVPVPNHHQRNWILDVGVRDVDLPSLKGKRALDFYAKVKDEALNQRAFKHVPQPGDAAEEATVLTLMADWKEKNKKTKTVDNDDDDDSENEKEDNNQREGLLRGYPLAGWRVAIQKVISNKGTAQSIRNKAQSKKAQSGVDDSALAKLFGLASYTGRDKFRDECHDEIYEFSKTLPSSMNAGGRFVKAEAMLWAKEDQASWEVAATAEEDVDWTECQQLVVEGFNTMVDRLHATRKFRPFVATMLMAWLNEEGNVVFETEAVPGDIDVGQKFDEKFEQFLKDYVNSMREWAEQPLKDYSATLEQSRKGSTVVFPLTMEGLGHITPTDLAQTVTKFLTESYHVVFGTPEIPWAAVALEPSQYYDAAHFPMSFASTGLADFTFSQWYQLATNLASMAGSGTSGFFRKPSPLDRTPTPCPEDRPQTPTARPDSLPPMPMDVDCRRTPSPRPETPIPRPEDRPRTPSPRPDERPRTPSPSPDQPPRTPSPRPNEPPRPTMLQHDDHPDTPTLRPDEPPCTPTPQHDDRPDTPTLRPDSPPQPPKAPRRVILKLPKRVTEQLLQPQPEQGPQQQQGERRTTTTTKSRCGPQGAEHAPRPLRSVQPASAQLLLQPGAQRQSVRRGSALLRASAQRSVRRVEAQLLVRPNERKELEHCQVGVELELTSNLSSVQT
ncbi:hypothetical protein MSAN_01891700 [Mycena sanguinolenta]|uniref:Uncharacterized protein n=1 Tax=Mycena sanguinolenta TaxID=230812 RepID=A0A8H6XRS7_9AGAR|nr:hypothetical protein MSAN_01891700 [Mycena sanguinolenta]